MTEQEQFLQDLEPKPENVLDKISELEPVVEPEKVEPEDEQKAKNRRERRLLEQNQRLREEAIAASTRAQVLSEVNKFKDEVGDDHLKKVEAIFGTDTAEKLAATNILKEALMDMSESAVKKALDQVSERETKASQAVQEEERTLDTMLERIEDDHGADFSNESTRKGFLTLLEKASPKDRDGNIIEYADADYIWEQFEKSREKPNDRAKQLATRSMTTSGASQPSKLEEDANWKALKDAGIF